MKIESICLASYNCTFIGYLQDNYEDIDIDRIRPALIICPGGAYAFCSNREAEPAALRYAAMGYQTFVLKYSTYESCWPVPQCELAEAVAHVRENAERYHVNPNQIAVMGFSAGGHLAASLGCFYSSPWLLEKVNRQAKECRPDALILAYPVISSGHCGHAQSFKNLMKDSTDLSLVSLELQVHSDMPPVFLWHTGADETVPAENSLLFASALAEKKVPYELHIFPQGRHGYSLADKETDDGRFVPLPHVQQWVQLSHQWLQEILNQ